jgi:hypothetical protein
MADELDPGLEATLRLTLRADVDGLPFTLRAADLEQALVDRRHGADRRRFMAAAAAVVLVAGLGIVALGWQQVDQRVAQSPSAPVQSPAVVPMGIASFEELERLPSAPTSVLVRGEGGPGVTVLQDIPGIPRLRAAITCTDGEIVLRLQPRGSGPGVPDASSEGIWPAPSARIACRPQGVTASLDIGTASVAGGTLGIEVQAPVGVVWRLVAGTGEVPAPTPPAEACARVTSAEQARIVVLRDTFADMEKGEGATVWRGAGTPPETAATWDDSAGIGEVGTYRGVSTFQLDARAHCLEGWRIEYATAASVDAARAVGRAPDDVTLAAEGTAEAPSTHTVDFDLPDRGHYVVRAILGWRAQDGSVVRDVRLWRLWTDAIEYYPDIPHPDPAVPCGVPDADAPAPPAVTIAHHGVEAATGVHMGGRWNDRVVPRTVPLPSDVVELSDGTDLQLRTAGDVCAIAWVVTYAPVPTEPDGFEATGEALALQGNPSFEPAYAQENRIDLGALPPGEWIVEADLLFEDGSGRTWFRVRVGG